MKGSKGTLAMVALAALTACGGGGSGTASAPVLTVTGQAAKGLMANADVAVYAVGADGQLAATPMATATTDSAGKYELKFTAVKGQPFVIKVSARSDGSTTHLDEVTGQQQSLPSGFSMRALLLPETDGQVSTSVSVTPFSEMAVSAASKASGGITAANAKQANSTIEQLLGFNPTTVSVVPAKDAATPEQQKLAVMLTAVSQMASNGDLDCGAVESKTQCVVEKLSKSVNITSMELANGASAALQTATQTVLNKPELVGAVQVSTLSNIVTNLGCKDDACKVGSTPVAPDPMAAAITSAKMLFTQIKTDLTTMFSQDGVSASSVGSFNKEAFKFQTAMTGIQAPVEMVAKDVKAMLLGLQLYRDFKSGQTDNPNRADWYGKTATDGFPSYWASGVVCTLYQDSATSVVSTNASNANFIGCSARFYVARSYSAYPAYTETQWRHGFTITPHTDGSFSYTSRARQRINACVNGSSCTTTANTALQPEVAAFAGTLTPTWGSDVITGVTLKGELPAAFKSGSITLVNYKSAVDLSGTQTLNAGEVTALSLTGSVIGYKDASTQESRLALNKGSIDRNNGAAFNVVWNTGAAEFEGDFGFSGITTDKSGQEPVPTQLKLKGMLRNIANGVSTEFLSGSLSANVIGYGGFDASQPPSASNKFTTNMQFVGAVTAPSRPKLEISLGAGMVKDGADTPLPVTLQYRTLVNDTPRSVVTLTATPGTPATFKLAENTSGLSMNWAEGASETDLVFGNPSVKIGTVKKNGMVNFTDGSFMSLDLGL